ncbi:hypothetical protein H6G04_21035 [Calothrix membranacea FACHB-236]|nr:hypothetical protein [Calothrix membranacea FACHB-236]
MIQDLLRLASRKIRSVCADMSSHSLYKWGYIRLRIFKSKCSPWLTLAIAPFKLLCSSGNQRTYEYIRYLSALSKIDFVGLYGVLNDLLW